MTTNFFLPDSAFTLKGTSNGFLRSRNQSIYFIFDYPKEGIEEIIIERKLPPPRSFILKALTFSRTPGWDQEDCAAFKMGMNEISVNNFLICSISSQYIPLASGNQFLKINGCRPPFLVEGGETIKYRMFFDEKYPVKKSVKIKVDLLGVLKAED